MSRTRHSFGIVGGLGALAGADVFFKLVKLSPAISGSQQSDIVLEQHPFPEAEAAGARDASQTARKLYVYDMLRSFQQRKIDTVLLPCFISHTFLEELTAEIPLPIVDLMEALRTHLRDRFPEVTRIGVLTSDYVRHRTLFERTIGPDRLIYPADRVQAECLMAAIYGPDGIKGGLLQGTSIRLLREACEDLVQQGAEVILPGFTEIPTVLDALLPCSVPIIDCNQAYAKFAVQYERDFSRRVSKIGIVGGVGPAATVDFMNKIIRNTRAKRDQEHVKLVVEHNPQIPDRTANLVAGGSDPTVALYAACKKLEADDADLIAIPCNTAHAFVDRIQPYLAIPIVNMLSETLRYIQARFPAGRVVGLLATDGTVKSGVFREAAEKEAIRLVVPDEPFQRKVMEAIYGERGVKAGCTEGRCREDLTEAMEHLVRDKGADILILGCTELPLLASQDEDARIADSSVAILDPTEILARTCVELVREIR